MKEKLSASLKQLSTLKIGGTADIYYPEHSSEMVDLLTDPVAPLVIGGGSNSVFEDKNYERKIICTSLLNKIEKKGRLTRAAAGVKLSFLFDFAAGTPATVGGGIYNNYGAFGNQLFDHLDSVEVYDRSSSELSILKADRIEHSYRHSLFHDQKDLVILAGYFRSTRPDNELERFLQTRREKQLTNYPNAGSLFKNPTGYHAAKLIEESGLKGFSVGDLQIWEQHANILINKGKATLQDFQQLTNTVKVKVKNDHNILLQEEIEIIRDQ